MRRGCSHRIGGLLAGVAESVDAGDLKSPAFGRAGSSPASGTTSGACPAPRTAREGRRASFDSMRSRPSSALRFHGMNFPLSGSTPALVSCGSFSLSRPDYLWHYLVIFSRISWVILSFSLVSSSPQSSVSRVPSLSRSIARRTNSRAYSRSHAHSLAPSPRFLQSPQEHSVRPLPLVLQKAFRRRSSPIHVTLPRRNQPRVLKIRCRTTYHQKSAPTR